MFNFEALRERPVYDGDPYTQFRRIQVRGKREKEVPKRPWGRIIIVKGTPSVGSYVHPSM